MLNVFSSKRAARFFSAHLSAVTLTVFAYYAYRDILPLMMLAHDRPPDTYTDGKRLWIKFALVTFAGVIEPLFEPFPYIPVDPEVSTALFIRQCRQLMCRGAWCRTLLSSSTLNKQPH